LPTGCTLLAESAVHVDELDRSVLENRISEVRAELEGAVDEKKTRLEQFIAELTKLGEIVIPA
ncbi:MAG TPA: F0F1 ATP synthase subunit epsilon, partial [Sinorhizobium sp.]|nr:F0F1 ATP synthase subunit epsilon [Sinorhizobium sp.]